MPSVIINNLFKVNDLFKLKPCNESWDTVKTPSSESFQFNRNLLFERKIIQIKCKYPVINQFAKQNYFLQLHEGTGWDIYWTDRQFLSTRHLKSLMPYQRINYFPGMSILTNKQNLTERLNLFRELFPEDYNFFPETWVVKKNSTSDVAKIGVINTSALTFASKISKEALQVFSKNNTNITVPLAAIPSIVISPQSPTLQNTDYKLSDLEKKPSFDTAGIKPVTLTLVNRLNSSNTIIESMINENGVITHHSKIVKNPLQDITNVIEKIPQRIALNIFERLPIVESENLKQTETTKNETSEKFSKENIKTKTEPLQPNEKRTTILTNEHKEINIKLRNLGIKSNSLFQANLRRTKTPKQNLTNNFENKSPFHRNSMGQFLFKDNVKFIISHLNRENHNKVKTVGVAGLKKNNSTSQDLRDSDHVEHSIAEEKDLIKETENIPEIAIQYGMSDGIKSESGSQVIAAETLIESDPIYILKPCDGCQGKGIKLAMNNIQIENNMEFESMICQQYIKNPLLWNGFKFDIRFYVLITSVKQLRVYVYKEGIVRLATEKYQQPDEGNMYNMFMHLTNYSINKDSENFNQDLSKQSLERMNRFLQDEHGVDIAALYAKIHDIIVKTILTGYRSILREYLDTFKNHIFREACFQVLGFDIILDSKCNPYLLEINKNASLKRPTPIDKLVKTRLTSDLFSILNLNENRMRGDILRDNLNYRTYVKRYIEHEMKHRGSFKLIYPCIGVEKYTKYILEMGDETKVS